MPEDSIWKRLQKNLLGTADSVDVDGKVVKGATGTLAPIMDTSVAVAGSINAWRSLQETKDQNKHIRAGNKMNATNAMNIYNDTRNRQTRKSLTMGGKSEDDINKYLASKAYQDKQAVNYK